VLERVGKVGAVEVEDHGVGCFEEFGIGGVVGSEGRGF
jgi:hypothetical protein